MKRFNNLFDKVASFENLILAAKTAQAGKRFKSNVAYFNFFLEKEVIALERELKNQTYKPGAYRHFYIYDPKKRLISAAPYRDRVVHHALCNVIEPIFDNTFIYDSYACRWNKGTHKAVNRFSQFCRKNNYVLKCDIRKYFACINHKILYRQLEKKIKDKKIMWLIDMIIGSRSVSPAIGKDNVKVDVNGIKGKVGIPVGNLTSQFFANIYLNGFDHFIKETLRRRYYIRYVDDFVIFDNEKAKLNEIKQLLIKYLERLGLHIHINKCIIAPASTGLDFLGYRIFPTHRLIRNSNGFRFRRRFKKMACDYNKHKLAFKEVNQHVQSWIGHAEHADTYGLRKRMFKEVVFKRE